MYINYVYISSIHTHTQRSNLNNSLSIPVGMYMYVLTYSQNNHTCITHYHLELFYQFIVSSRHSCGVNLRSFPFNFPFMLFIHPFFLFLPLVALTQNCHMLLPYCMFTYIYCLLIDKSQNVSFKFLCALLVYLCL